MEMIDFVPKKKLKLNIISENCRQLLRYLDNKPVDKIQTEVKFNRLFEPKQLIRKFLFRTIFGKLNVKQVKLIGIKNRRIVGEICQNIANCDSLKSVIFDKV